MAKKNLLEAVVEAIAESDNEVGGMVMTRLTEAHEYGTGNGYLRAIDPGVLRTKTAVFKSTDVGKLVDILEADPSTGNHRTCVVVGYLSPTSIALQDLLAVTPTWSDEDDVRWRFASLRVESAYDFKRRDKNMQLWVGNESGGVLYCETKLLPGAQEFRGLGHHVGGQDGVIDVLSPTVLTVGKAGSFVAGDVGKALWVLPSKSGSTANAGPRVIFAVVNDRTVQLSGAVFTADETEVAWRLKTYTDAGYLTRLQQEDAEVYDGSQGQSGLDHLRRALLVEYAEGEELDRIARRHGLSRPRGCPDETWRRLLMCLPYMAKTTIYSLEIALAALFPQGGWSVYENLGERPCEVFISTPQMDPSGTYEGKAFLDGKLEVNSNTANTIPMTTSPTTIASIRSREEVQRLDMDVLPSADSPAWSYVNEGATEGATFSISAGTLGHGQLLGTPVGGRYRRTVSWVGPGQWKIGGWWVLFGVPTLVGGFPWKFIVRDGQREVCMFWDYLGSIKLGSAAEVAVASVAWPGGVNPIYWHYYEMEAHDGIVEVRVNGLTVLSADLSLFGASSSTDFSFGYVNNALNQNWACLWDGVQIVTQNPRDYSNVRRTDGGIVNPGILNSASNPFLAGDTGKRVRVYSPTRNENDGVWIATYVSAGQVTLEGETRSDAAVETVAGVSRVTLDHPRFTARDPDKYIKLTGSSTVPPNDGSFRVLSIEDDYTAVVSNPGGFVTENDLTWRFDEAYIWTESGLVFEVIDTAVWAASQITTRDALPAAITPVEVFFTTVLSGQVLLDEFVENKGEIVGEPDLYYPFYLFDVDRLTRDIIDMITAAGITPRYGEE